MYLFYFAKVFEFTRICKDFCLWTLKTILKMLICVYCLLYGEHSLDSLVSLRSAFLIWINSWCHLQECHYSFLIYFKICLLTIQKKTEACFLEFLILQRLCQKETNGEFNYEHTTLIAAYFRFKKQGIKHIRNMCSPKIMLPSQSLHQVSAKMTPMSMSHSSRFLWLHAVLSQGSLSCTSKHSEEMRGSISFFDWLTSFSYLKREKYVRGILKTSSFVFLLLAAWNYFAVCFSWWQEEGAFFFPQEITLMPLITKRKPNPSNVLINIKSSVCSRW